MNEYIERLKRIGFKTLEAARLCECIARYIDLTHLNKFIEDLEREGYVANVQS